MKVLGLVAVAALVVWLMIRQARRQIALARADDELAAAQGFVAAVDPATGKLAAVADDLDAMRRRWHPIRFPEGSESRSAGLPAEKAYSDTGFAGRRAWCEAHCRGRWRLEDTERHGLVFWFEDQKDAAEFSLAWFPFKCV